MTRIWMAILLVALLFCLPTIGLAEDTPAPASQADVLSTLDGLSGEPAEPSQTDDMKVEEKSEKKEPAEKEAESEQEETAEPASEAVSETTTPPPVTQADTASLLDNLPSEPAPEEPAEEIKTPDEPLAKEKQPEKLKDDAASIGEVVVTAARDEEEPFFSDRSVEVISEKELTQQSPRTVPEAFRESPGVWVQQTNNGGGSPIMRGMVGPQVLLQLDGVRLNNSVYRGGPLQYLNLLDAYMIERLEAVRGPGSVLYGSDAMGGTINAVTFDPVDRRDPGGFGWNGRLAAKYGSAAREKTAHGLLDLGYDGFGFNLGATIKDFDDLEGGRGVGTQPYTSYRQVNVMSKLSARVLEGFMKDWSFQLAYHMSRMFDVGRAEGLEVKHSYAVYQNDMDLLYGRILMKFKPVLTNLRLTVSWQRFDEDKETNNLDDSNDVTLESSIDNVNVNTVGVDAQFATKLFEERFRLVYGVEYFQDFVDSSREERDATHGWQPAERDPYPENAEYRLIGVYLDAKGDLLPKDWDWGLALKFGYRWQLMGGKADPLAGSEDLVANLDTNYENNAHIMQAGIETNYKRYWMAAFTWSQGFRSPNLQESVMFGVQGDWFHVANDDLGPERGDTFELLSRFDFWRVNGSMAGYVTLVSDTLQREFTTLPDGREEVNGYLVLKNVNGGEAKIWGIETNLGLDLWWGLSLNSAVTFTEGTQILDEPDDQGRTEVPLSKIPPVFGRAGLRWDGDPAEWAKLFAEAYVLFAGKQDRLSDGDIKDVRIPDGGTPGWATVNFRIGATLREHWILGLTLENLSNEKYKYHASGVWGAGTNALLTVEARY